MGNKLVKENTELKELMDRFDVLEKILERNVTFLEDKLTHK